MFGGIWNFRGFRMKYLTIKGGASKTRADGSRYANPLWVTKNRRYGKVLEERTISRKKPVFIAGAHDSGKTRTLERLYDREQEIWGAKHKSPALYLSCLRPLAGWTDNEVIEAWQNNRHKSDPENHKSYSRLKQWERAEILSEYCDQTKCVLFIDDAHKLSGRKLQIARECLINSRVFVVSASEEQRVPPNLRSVMLRRKPQTYRLDTEVAYDATDLLMYFFIIAALGAGYWELSLVLGALKALGSGRRSSRAE